MTNSIHNALFDKPDSPLKIVSSLMFQAFIKAIPTTNLRM